MKVLIENQMCVLNRQFAVVVDQQQDLVGSCQPLHLGAEVIPVDNDDVVVFSWGAVRQICDELLWLSAPHHDAGVGQTITDVRWKAIGDDLDRVAAVGQLERQGRAPHGVTDPDRWAGVDPNEDLHRAANPGVMLLGPARSYPT